MKIIINNKTKEILDSVCLVKVYQFITEMEIVKQLDELSPFIPITFEKLVCLARKNKGSYSFTFLDIKEKRQWKYNK